MAKKKEVHEEEEGGEAWLLPYSDLMTLLLAVFIVLFAVSNIDLKKAEKLAKYFSKNMIVQGSETDSETEVEGTFNPDEILNIETPENTTAPQPQATALPSDLENFLGQYELNNLNDLKYELDSMFSSNSNSSSISTSVDKRGLVITLNNAILFDSGSAEIKAEQIETLKKIASQVNLLDNYIRIEGHTDNRPIDTVAFPSNWELSSARASNVVKLFINDCSVLPEKIVAVGYGEYKPVADNANAEGRSKNRRIDIIILSEKYNNLEQQIIP